MTEQEGVVKFQVRHTPGAAPSHPQLENLIRLRDELFRLGLIGMNDQGIGYGNVSIGTHDGFIISGTGTGGIPQLPPDGCCLVASCDPRANTVDSYGPVAASSEAMTHYAVYTGRTDVRCVLHVHAPALFRALLQDGTTPATPPDAPYGTPAMAEAVRELAAQTRAGLIVMAGHEDGVLAFGPDCTAAREILMAAVRAPGE